MQKNKSNNLSELKKEVYDLIKSSGKEISSTEIQMKLSKNYYRILQALHSLYYDDKKIIKISVGSYVFWRINE